MSPVSKQAVSPWLLASAPSLRGLLSADSGRDNSRLATSRPSRNNCNAFPVHCPTTCCHSFGRKVGPHQSNPIGTIPSFQDEVTVAKQRQLKSFPMYQSGNRPNGQDSTPQLDGKRRSQRCRFGNINITASTYGSPFRLKITKILRQLCGGRLAGRARNATTANPHHLTVDSSFPGHANVYLATRYHTDTMAVGVKPWNRRRFMWWQEIVIFEHASYPSDNYPSYPAPYS